MSSTTTSSSTSNTIFQGLGNLIKLLPTGTLFMFQFLIPIVTNSGHCTVLNKYLTGALLVVCAFTCVFASFTDSYTGSDGVRHYAVVTPTGLWPSPASDGVDLSSYKLRLGDFVHALSSLTVFAILGLLDTNTVGCFYPSFESSEKALVQVLPTVVGAVTSAVFVMFPNNRHGIGYPTSEDPNDTTSSKTSTA
ncbi:hypothetical protein PIB30_034998 [Stylosanthes scabra]|uniref:DUF679 domain-containing protein n=1 Tax=Stylosanthes scabra TaxID=79078 RepID=A0ABU6SCY2_9FABA|nr:hypothetical protein [Stylosanthes scabra]